MVHTLVYYVLLGGGPSGQGFSTTVVRTVPGMPARITAASQTRSTHMMPPKLSNCSLAKPTTAERYL